eukprot:CAMPEP_0114429202 /NCGR_PEP_ID=MMETSP0103-20121206/9348_1 /TAXON_ID=37642 ORGANISM="Paraphysomonas imperforata, Strain PA2" /NCGR_SAMPLE_ID=MMETSP0103 /ASSEMBLY_ACC=CAM_ASM_000201 /LENGTH=334 /DNA_ID=CAMNT_0001598499 /DNA_START=246 /DNA_END=1250 /DNA_ORIENTATION=-
MKFDSYSADNKNISNGSSSRNNAIKTGSVKGFSFVSQVGPLDCSIGSIFRDEFGKNLKMPKTSSSDDQMGRALSVMIIDDSVIQRKLTMRTLGGLIDEVVWMVEGAENGECALNLIETSPRVPDVIIIDQYMQSSGGRLLGHEVVAELRRNPIFDTAVIVGCTGSAEEAAPLFLDAGCDAVWSKPMPSKEEAQSQIIALLEKRKSSELFADRNIGNNSPRDDPSQSGNGGIFTLENTSNFSNGVASNVTPQRQHKQQQQAAAIPTPESSHQPVFLQMLTTRVSDGPSSYFVNGGSNSTGSVFQFGTPPPPSEQKAPSGDVANVTEAISKINMSS